MVTGLFKWSILEFVVAWASWGNGPFHVSCPVYACKVVCDILLSSFWCLPSAVIPGLISGIANWRFKFKSLFFFPLSVLIEICPFSQSSQRTRFCVFLPIFGFFKINVFREGGLVTSSLTSASSGMLLLSFPDGISTGGRAVPGFLSSWKWRHLFLWPLRPPMRNCS